MWGFAHLMAHHREAFFFESHIFTQPPRRCDSMQWQKQPPAGTVRSSAGVSARSVNEQVKKMTARTLNRRRPWRRKAASLKNRSTGVFCGRRRKKPIAHNVRRFCYQSPRTSSESKRECRFGLDGLTLPQPKLNILKHLSNHGLNITLVEAVQ
jgi:hypothetical protein